MRTVHEFTSDELSGNLLLAVVSVEQQVATLTGTVLDACDVLAQATATVEGTVPFLREREAAAGDLVQAATDAAASGDQDHANAQLWLVSQAIDAMAHMDVSVIGAARDDLTTTLDALSGAAADLVELAGYLAAADDTFAATLRDQRVWGSQFVPIGNPAAVADRIALASTSAVAEPTERVLEHAQMVEGTVTDLIARINDSLSRARTVLEQAGAVPVRPRRIFTVPAFVRTRWFFLTVTLLAPPVVLALLTLGGHH